MKDIPVSAALEIAERFGFDQVVIIGRKVGEAPAPHGEHVTTYGIDQANCAAAALVGNFLKHKVMGWPIDGATLAAARDAWQASDEGRMLASDINGPVGGKYLRNRLELAFVAGYDAATHKDAER